VPKVIDFGVAKATAQRLTERTMFTEVGQIVGTLEYMAPEQAELNNLDIDTRADIYSLGVLLYELLTGSPPFTAKQLRSVAFTEMLRMIRESEPPKPSTKLSSSEELPSIAANRKLEPAKLAKLVRGDLDWMVMKCLEKERGRRYETANGLALDVQRYLADEPVQASPPSATYRLRKFVRKHRGPVLAAGIVTGALLAGVVGTSWGLVRADRSRKLAEKKEHEALAEKTKADASQQQAIDALQATTDDVMENLLWAKPVLGPQERAFLQVTLKCWQAFAAEQGEAELARSIRALGVLRVADLRRRLGQNEEARAGYQEAIQLYALLTAEFPDWPSYRVNLAAGYQNLGLLLHDLGMLSEAEDAGRQALGQLDKLVAEFPDSPAYRERLGRSQSDLGNVLRHLGKFGEAEKVYRQSLTSFEELANAFPSEPRYQRNLAKSHHNLGIIFHDQSNLPQAEAAYRQALALYEKLPKDLANALDSRHGMAWGYQNLGNALLDRRNFVEAEAAFGEALRIDEKLAAEFPAVPEYRRQLAYGQRVLGIVLAELGKFPQAEAAIHRALTIFEKLAGEFREMLLYPIGVGQCQIALGNIQRISGRPEQALAWYTQSIETLEVVVPQWKDKGNPQGPRQGLRSAYWGRAQVLDGLKRHAQAGKDWDKLVKLSSGPEVPPARVDRATSRARGGDWKLALQEAEELASLDHPLILYNVACIFALAADRQQEGRDLLSKEDCARWAMTLLQQAVANGYKDVEHVKHDDDLKALRSRDDFKKLLADLEAKRPK